MKIASWIALILWSTIVAQAQNDRFAAPFNDTINVIYSLPAYGKGQHYEVLDSADLQRYSSQNLAQVLALESTFFIKNYGPSGISTISGRGGSASQTAILWEGFNLQNSMLGQSDLSLIPLFFIDKIDLQYGGGSSFFGTSGVGGAIHLSSHNPQKYKRGLHLKVQLSAGSFETLQQNVGIAYNWGKYTTEVRFFHRQAKNNYWFTNTNAFGTPKPVERQSHAATKQWGIFNAHDFFYKKSRFALKTWYQSNHRQLPPTLLTSSSLDRQEDQAWRTAFNWKTSLNNVAFKARTAFFWERLYFESGAVQSESQILSSISEAETRWYWGDVHTFQAGLHYSYYRAQSQGYQNTPQQSRPALFLHYRFLSVKEIWKANISVRQEWVDALTQRPAASLGFIIEPLKGWRLNAHASHNYRLPTFNDLYWEALGNPDLLPEYSWNTELGSSLNFQAGRYQVELSANGFCNWIDNWILWSPNDAGLWRPSNVDKVLARGLESSFNIKANWKDWEAQFRAQHSYTQSTRTQGEDPRTLGKQLVYVPAHQGNAALFVAFRQTSALLQTQWTGARFTNNTNSAFLPAFALLNLRLEHRLTFGKGGLVLYGQANNLLGAEYQVVLNRPMPWQQFELGLQFFL